MNRIVVLLLVMVHSTACLTSSRQRGVQKAPQALVLPFPKPLRPPLLASAAPTTLTAPPMDASIEPCPFRYLV